MNRVKKNSTELQEHPPSKFRRFRGKEKKNQYCNPRCTVHTVRAMHALVGPKPAGMHMQKPAGIALFPLEWHEGRALGAGSCKTRSMRGYGSCFGSSLVFSSGTRAAWLHGCMNTHVKTSMAERARFSTILRPPASWAACLLLLLLAAGRPSACPYVPQMRLENCVWKN